ncbi:hypothetical protein L2E82_44750 [Cichorium intybus]|uniref:Uncharacterized protein n=1 Tax=Cichorium intybus TaxID=13427 RepID=A0ACB8ZQ41_CICIN|nr:hypothetical protein L2E82_44750 [Cichorium intybus]
MKKLAKVETRAKGMVTINEARSEAEEDGQGRRVVEVEVVACRGHEGEVGNMLQISWETLVTSWALSFLLDRVGLLSSR